jgi:hypothetical protein
LPCRLQICFNGYNWLAGQLRKLGIDYRMADNVSTYIADWQRAQHISNSREAKRNHARLSQLARMCCRFLPGLRHRLPLSVDQCEYATDTPSSADKRIGRRSTWRARDSNRQARQHRHFPRTQVQPAVRRRNGQPFQHRHRRDADQTHHGAGSDQAVCTTSSASFSDTTVNDPTFFKHHREGNTLTDHAKIKWASMQKTLNSLPSLRELLEAANRRYLEFLSAIEDLGPEETNSTNFPQWNSTAVATLDSICSTRAMRTRYVPSFAASSIAADYRTNPFATTCRNSAAARCHVCSNDSEHTDSSKRSGT